mgnify:CR=1 FL=1
MARAVWKGPFVDPSLIKKVEKLKNQPNKTPIKTWSRKSTIIPEFVGHSFLIHNGKKFISIKISEEMVGHKLGEFSPTRQFSGHTPADKKAAQTAAQDGTATTTTAPSAPTATSWRALIRWRPSRRPPLSASKTLFEWEGWPGSRRHVSRLSSSGSGTRWAPSTSPS